jgi:hypothetical protein
MRTLGSHVRSAALAVMRNKAMQNKLMKGKAIDVRAIGVEVEPGVFELRLYRDGVDYCDAKKEQWIRSIGKRWADGRLFAAIDGRYWGNGAFECVWLR